MLLFIHFGGVNLHHLHQAHFPQLFSDLRSLLMTFIYHKNKFNDALVNFSTFQHLLKFERQKHVSNNKALPLSYSKRGYIFVSFDKLLSVLKSVQFQKRVQHRKANNRTSGADTIRSISRIFVWCVPLSYETSLNPLSTVLNCKTDWLVGRFNQYFPFEYICMAHPARQKKCRRN